LNFEDSIMSTEIPFLKSLDHNPIHAFKLHEAEYFKINILMIHSKYNKGKQYSLTFD